MNYFKCMKAMSKLAIVSVEKPCGYSKIESYNFKKKVVCKNNKHSTIDRLFRAFYNLAIVHP